MSKISETIEGLYYIIDCLKELETIHNSGSCNDCRLEKNCSIKPECGQLVRFNCVCYLPDGTVNSSD